MACLAALAGGMFGAALPHAAEAAGLGFSYTPSKTEPYAVCGRPTPGHSACLAILDPTAAARSLSASPESASPTLASPSYKGSGVGGGFAPADLRSAYGLPSESAGSGQTVAIVDAYDDPKAESDLGVYRSHYGLPACTTANGCFKKVNQKGETTNLPEGEPHWAIEISLDLDMASAACPNCHIMLVEAENAENVNLYAAEDEAATLGATEISNSWGGEESAGETSFDTYFNHTGVPITASAGDSGYEVEYPAASQYVIAVGGTALTQASNSRGWSETVWNKTGGGCSAYEPKPAWQTASPDCTKRTNNDIAAVASTETPVSLADSYEVPAEFKQPEPGWTLAGGTSVSSPLMAGTMALANAYTRSFAGADAYYMEAAQNGTGVLDDVTSGNNVKKGAKSCGNYLCEAGPGYDGPTGLGSPYGAPVVLHPPTVVTKAATSIAQTTATLNASVNPNGGSVGECKIEYGTNTEYKSGSATCTPSPGAGESAVAVSGSATGLSANTTYHFRISATNAGGTSKGSDETFKTLPNAPTVVTKAATSVAQTTATLNASVNPNGGSVSECKIEYGTNTEYKSGSATCTPSPGSGEGAVAVSGSVTGLTANTTYHFRVVATNPGGTSDGSDETLKSCTAEGFCASFDHSEPSEFPAPTAVAVGSSGAIWVAGGHDQLLEFNSKREYVSQFGSEGTGEGQFKGIGGIATNSSGDIYVTDSGNNRVEEFSPTGAYLRQFGSAGLSAGEFSSPTGIAIDSAGNVWVLNSHGVLVQEFSATGTYISGFGSAGWFEGPEGLAFSGGNLYVTEPLLGRVQEYSTSGTSLAIFDERGSGNGKSQIPWGIASDPSSGNLYVTDPGSDRVQEFSSSGSFIAAFGSEGSGAGQFSDPEGVAVGSSGSVFIADSHNNRVEEFTAPKVSGEAPAYAASITHSESSEFPAPSAVAVGSSANVWVAGGHDQLLEFNSKREYVSQFGSEGTGEGQFKGIGGIATNSSGDIYVTDAGNNRVEEFSPTGAYLRQFGSAGLSAGQFSSPTGIAIDSAGDVWVLNSHGALVQEFSATGTYVSGFGSAGGLKGPRASPSRAGTCT